MANALPEYRKVIKARELCYSSNPAVVIFWCYAQDYYW
jgi:hypothetical protein